MNNTPKTKTYIQATCARCGKKYYKSETNHRQKYCSRDCNQKAKDARKTEKRTHTKPCAVCGKLFETTSSRKKYCSAECAYEADLKCMRAYSKRKYREYREYREAAQAVSVQPAQPRTLMQKIRAFFRRSK